MGRLWDSLDPIAAAPISADLAAELDRRESEADAAPEAGGTWPDIHSALLRKLRYVPHLRVRAPARHEIASAFDW